MSNKFILVCALFAIINYDSASALSRSYSAGGVWSNVNSNGFSIRQEPNQLFCGSLICINAVNCEIIKHGSNIHEKCADLNGRIIDQKSYSGSSFGDDVELYFGPAYARQAEEQSRIIGEQVQDQINNAFSNFPPHLLPNNNNNNYNNNMNSVYRSEATSNGKIISSLSMLVTTLLICMAR
ncbi:uncharacterized protein LOC129610354 [Condylostylus longicornis]|uniref:uncharacterized protein LOC129610354 n=1 Tax=Condylostylus longicornis TaxID=2530218 RepID=UPI00244DB159|nr:uncharacterized protein LOC129610354 [Condylostylus longicornis]XP_055378886.1 uncharacterized protein LOC129610354 [Condylostylus longicornis]XP_055378887.1 uncharacterized protein LOC129610354 [Condylostylus longicornis]XP_055378888.1 uncharacterized protein LOC129610354 [Condylostylus longicornis]XP_055378889.1 uncharacterized protein LOC129610354 [Condylostylus longicornis]